MEKEFQIKIGGIKESLTNLESLEAALESIEKKTENINRNGGFSVATKEGNKALDELAKLTQKITQYDEEYEKAVEASKGVLKDKNKVVKEAIELEKANITVEEGLQRTYYEKQQLLSALGKQIKSMTTDTEDQKRKQQELIQQYNTLNKELKDFDATMGNHQRNVGDYRGALKEATAELKSLKGQMVGVEQGTKEWEELSKQAGAYADKIGDINAAIKRQASDTKHLDDVINLAKSATAAFTLWKGAMSAFGLETEAAEEAIQKLAGAMSIIQSLQTLSDTLQASSASATLLNKTMKVLTLGINGTTVASKALRIALASIGIGLVIALVTTLITHWEDLLGWLQKTFPFLSNLQQKFVGLGKAIVNWVTNPIVTLAKVIQKVFSGDFAGALEEVKKGIINQFKGTLNAYSKGYQEAMTSKAIEEENKRTEYAYKMLQAKAGAEAKYSKQGIALQKKIFAQRKQMAKGNAEELKQIALDEASYFRECQEYKNKVAKKSADERKKQEKEAAAAAKEAERLAKQKAKEEEEARKQAEKEEQERIKELNDARKDGANAEIAYQKAVLNERKRVVNESISVQEKEEKQLNSQIDQLQKIANNEQLSKKTRREASEQLERTTARLMRVEEDRKNLLDKELDIEKQIVNLNKEKAENAVFEDLKNNLSAITMSKDEFYSLIDGTSDKLTGYTETQLQYVKNAVMQMKTITQEAKTAIESLTTGTNNKKSQGSGSSGGGDTGSTSTPWENSDWVGKMKMMAETAFLPAMDTISMFMDFALEETQQELDQITELHDKAMDKVEESADKIRELNAKLKDSANDNKEATAEQLADEQLLYAQRIAEEKKLAEEEKKMKNKVAQEEAKARKLELGYQMVMGIANTAEGVTKALSSFPPPLSFVMAGLVGAMGAVQTALIAAQIAKVKPVKYADGGIINGKPHSQGGARIEGTNLEVEGGEMVVSKKNTERYRDVLYKINSNDPSVRYLQSNRGTYADTKIRKYADGGQLNFQAVDQSLRANDVTNRLMDAIESIDMQPVVSVVDINRVQERLTRVRSLAGRS